MKHILSLLLPAMALSYASLSYAQGAEVEPNHPCPFAQMFGEVTLPFFLTGSLDALAIEGDVDFFQFSGTPNAGIRAVLEGLDTGGGTLRDPFLGLFDSSCNLIMSANSGGGYSNARLLATIPTDGVFVLAATSCCDGNFEGNVGIGGSYTLTISRVALARSVAGRVVDAVSGAPLPGNNFPYSRVVLFRCTGEDCSEYIDSEYPNSNGEFLFDVNDWGDPLLAGTYMIEISADLHESSSTEPFELEEGEELDLGNISLIPVPRIGSIRGRVVDSVTNNPLAGDSPPYAWVQLRRCDGSGCSYEGSQGADSQGRFRFDADYSFDPLPTGNYKIEVSGDEYHPFETELFPVGEGEDVDVGDLLLEPFPIGFSEIRPCADLPAEGGLCQFSVRINNRVGYPIEGAAWSLVDGYGIGSLENRTAFQLGWPRRITLAAGESRTVRFGFWIPAVIRDGSSMCTDVYFGQGRTGFYFDTAGMKDLFCIQKGMTGVLRVLSEEESRRMLRERRENELRRLKD